MRISKKTEYAIKTLCFLGRNKKRFISVREIGGKEKIPLYFLGKILSLLSKNKIVGVKKGREGGYFLLLPLKKINILRIIFLFEKNKKIVECLEKNKKCFLQSSCYLRSVFKKLNHFFERKLKETTLKEIIDQKI